MPKKYPKKEKEKKNCRGSMVGGGLPLSALVGVGPGVGIGRDSYGGFGMGLPAVSGIRDGDTDI